MKYFTAALFAAMAALSGVSSSYALPCKSGINDSCEIKAELSPYEKAWIEFLK